MDRGYVDFGRLHVMHLTRAFFVTRAKSNLKAHRASSVRHRMAVKTQIWIAVSVYVLVAIVKKRLNLDASLYTLLQILSVTLFEKMPLQQAFPASDNISVEAITRNQLNLFKI